MGDPIQHIPWVRFVNASGARQAMDAIERQEVLIDGVVLRARWKPRGKDNLADAWFRPIFDAFEVARGSVLAVHICFASW